MSTYNLFLDDERFPNQVTWVTFPCWDWEVVRNMDEFIDVVESFGLPDFVSFDHDLGRKQPTGYDAAKWLVDYCEKNNLPLPGWQVHSLNPVGRDNVQRFMENAKKHESSWLV